MGGLSKKAFLIKGLDNDPARPALLVNSGNLLFPANQLEPSEAEAAKIAAETVVRATSAMGGTFAGIGSHDLAAGIAFLDKVQSPQFKWLSLNLIDPASRRPLFAPQWTQQVGDIRVALLALTDHTAFPAAQREFEVLDWRVSLPDALAKAEQQADCILLLSNYSYGENQEIAKRFSSIDLILQAGYAMGNRAPLAVNNALIGQTETRGKYLGVLDITWNGRSRWRDESLSPRRADRDQPASSYVNRFIAIKPAVPSDPAVEVMVRQAQQRIDALRQGQDRQPPR